MIHPTADVSPEAVIGANTKVWHRTQICAGARIGDDCIVGSNVYIDRGVLIGNRVKIQTGVQLYHGTVIEDGVFLGPMVCVTNDKYPRAITPDGRLKTDADWVQGSTRVQYGASLGAGCVVLPDVTVGRFAMIAAGAVVADNVPAHGLVVGVPARLNGYVCACGHRLRNTVHAMLWQCPSCQMDYLRLLDNTLCPAAEKPNDYEAEGLEAAGDSSPDGPGSIPSARK
jgi:acetyltransferase-like isoleucine patch superfamily enzyme